MAQTKEFVISLKVVVRTDRPDLAGFLAEAKALVDEISGDGSLDDFQEGESITCELFIDGALTRSEKREKPVRNMESETP